jgi:hypothetical protein
MWWRLTMALSAPLSDNETRDSRQRISEIDGGR